MLAAAPSKVPFYVAGALLAAWAVLLAIWGISHAEFPGAPSRTRLVLLTSILLVVATMTTAVLTAGEESEVHVAGASGAPKATGRTLALAADPAGGLRYDKNRAAVLAGRVQVTLANDSPVAHNVTIARGSQPVGATDTVTNASTSVTVTLDPGDYVFFCSVPGHRSAGMQGTLAVE